VLKSREAEFTALSSLSKATWEQLAPPLFEVLTPSVKRKTPLSIDQALAAFASSVAMNCDAAFAIDLGYVGDAWSSLATSVQGVVSGPTFAVTRLSDSKATVRAARAVAKGGGHWLRLSRGDITGAGAGLLDDRIKSWLAASGAAPGDVRVIVDLADLDPEQEPGLLVDGLVKRLDGLPRRDDWGALTIASTAPISVDPNVDDVVLPRRDWQLWRELATAKPARVPDYGDYAGSAAAPPPSDGRPKHPYLRYTTGDDCRVLRRQAPPGEGFVVFRDICKTLSKAPGFSRRHCMGDERIAEISNGKVKAGGGGPAGWRAIALAHHFTIVAEQLSSHPGP
jgi:hypothetical protein